MPLSRCYYYEKHFENDAWGLVNILKSADRRIGKRRLRELKSKTHNRAAHKIIEERLKEWCAPGEKGKI
jgi:hypothetical protein